MPIWVENCGDKINLQIKTYLFLLYISMFTIMRLLFRMENIVFNKKLIIKFDRIVQGAYLTRSQAHKKRYFH